eukprot:TRINITY_DN17822_c0_g1_i1.p1 TRINITY_DN17822_c0_g1~~TRINITY_DN17822_c0_g1_i1.p1  ORF type:complete len:737 (+),score=122.64 TRINITY_DN17822_c0_g1_i1:226-2436(+)
MATGADTDERSGTPSGRLLMAPLAAPPLVAAAPAPASTATAALPQVAALQPTASVGVLSTTLRPQVASAVASPFPHQGASMGTSNLSSWTGGERHSLRVDVPYPEIPSDADTVLPSWRSGLHSDWKLRLGPTTYNVHKVLTGHGPRASAFLCSAFTTGQQLATASIHAPATSDANDRVKDGDKEAAEFQRALGFYNGALGETDLLMVLPEQVWSFFPEVLDFVYSAEISLSEKNAVALLHCADVLQIRSLFLLCVDGINDLLTAVSAPRLLADASALLGGALAEQIARAAQNVIADNFDHYSVNELRIIPTAQLVPILRRDDLKVIHENEVFDKVLELTSLLGTCVEPSVVGCEEDAAVTRRRVEAEQTALWQTVRFGALSNSYVVKAAQVEAIPKMVLIWSKVVHRKCGSSSMQGPMMVGRGEESWSMGPPRPRRPFKDMVCAVMYSVDTDARNDQDVERNITAATLVAEEIEFLGGRAILENIFARAPSAKDSSESSIINMDHVDVAFVLAPWTPCGERISQLINFVDRGGGAVLLSFIGGLCKGQWLDGKYEPLITGKVADNTPYEDVYLATLPGCEPSCHDPLKRTQDSLSPPRILCGVDSISGRRRITSQLVDGAKVLATWSDLQPLVVQHPSKNVFSISQRVSRIFELDDDLGHDDTLQLVLNVMVQAGKAAWRLRGRHAGYTTNSTSLLTAGQRSDQRDRGVAGSGSSRTEILISPSLSSAVGGVNVSL